MKKTNRRLSLTLFFTLLIFLVLLVSIGLVGAILMFCIRQGWISPGISVRKSDALIWQMALASVILGSFLGASVGRIPLKPLNKLVKAMNQLAGGDYSTRLPEEKTPFLLPPFREVQSSFNHMAEELEQTEMLRADFVNNFSHEFKTPIVSIAGFAKLLRHGNLTEEQNKEYIAIIEEESLRLASLANNILNLTRVENQTILTNVTEFNLSEEIREAILLLENKWNAKNLFPEADFGEHLYRGNQELLKQIWINLLDNAIKFTPSGGEILVRITETPKHLLVSFSNTGREIPLEARERIFGKFYQLEESHSGSGNGIGLALARAVARLHGGDISCSSGSGRNVFTVVLPKNLQLSSDKENI